MKSLRLLFLLFTLTSNLVNAQNAFTNKYHIFLAQNTFLVNTSTQKKLYIVADSTPIYKNAIIKVLFPKIYSDIVKDGDFLANIRAGYTKVGSVSSGKKAQITAVSTTNAEFTTIPSSAFSYQLQHDVNQAVATIQLLDTLPQGDTLLVDYGANGTNTYTSNLGMAHEDDFSILVKNNTPTYEVVASKARVYILNSGAKSLYPVLSSAGKPGKPILLKLIVQDLFQNRSKNFSGTIQLNCSSNQSSLPTQVTITPNDSGKIDIYFSIYEKGVFTVSANVISGTPAIVGTFVSNPVNIGDDSLQIFFGDFHTHTKFSRDGLGSNAYDYARNGIGLDFYCGTDHSDDNPVDTFGIHPNEWEELKQESKLVHQPGRFVSFLGYENSLDNPSGHYNFIYDYPDSAMQEIPILARHFYFYIYNFWHALDAMSPKVRALTIPHHTGKLFFAPFTDNGGSQFGGTYKNEKYKRLIEIYSGHGLCEYYNPSHGLAYEQFNARSTQYPCYAQDAWAIGEKLGVISSTDSHNGKGEANASGLAAIISDTLTRSALFDNLYKRHTYATTGVRMVMKFYINNHLMGDTLTLPCDSFPKIAFEINATDNIDFIEVLKWDFHNGQYTTGSRPHPIYKIIKRIAFSNNTLNYKETFSDANYTDSSLYYIRIKQKNKIANRETWGWSSPIWVNKPNSCLYDTIRSSDSLFNFNAIYQNKKVELAWNIQDELLTNYYVIQRSIDSINFVNINNQDAQNIAFLDTSYHAIDSLLYAATYYYRIQQVFQNDSIIYSPIIRVDVPYIIDSIVQFTAQIADDHIANDWNTQEFHAIETRLLRSSKTITPQTIYAIPAYGEPQNVYHYNDAHPLDDTSFYKVVLLMNDGTYKISNTDTIVLFSNTLQDVNAIRDSNKVKICFEVIHQNNVDSFVIYRGIDSTHLTPYHSIQPSGNFKDTINYCIWDSLPFPGKNYYQVHAVQSNGTQHLSEIAQLNFITGLQYHVADELKITVLGNPIYEFQNEVLVNIRADKSYEGNLVLYDNSGRLLTSNEMHINNGNTIVKVPIYTLEEGVYHLLFTTNNSIAKTSFIVLHNHK